MRVLLLYIILPLCLFAEQVEYEYSDDNQFYYEKHIFEFGDENSVSLKQFVIKYTSSNDLVSISYYLSPGQQKETGIYIQEEEQTNNGMKYSMIFTDEYSHESGIDKLVEYCDINDEVTGLEYHKDGKLLFREEDNDKLTRFPFHTIAFIDKMMELDTVELDKTVYTYSQKYDSARSIVKFTGETADMDETDRDFLGAYLSARDAAEMAGLYHRKVKVEENGRQYYILFQDELLEHVKKNGRAAVYYYAGGLNRRLILISVGFTDIEE